MQQATRTSKAFWRLACALALAVACAFFVSIGAAGAAFGADAACFEGESMSDSSTAIAVVSDANAGGRCPTGGNKALAYVQTSETANKSVSFSSVAEKVEIRVRGADTNGAVTLPRVRVFIDGTDYANDAILDRQVTSSYATLTADLTRPADRAAGTHTIYVTMRNWDTGDKISVDGTAFTYAPAADTTPPSAPTITSPSTNGTTDTDGDLNFSFTGEGDASFECSLDSGTASYSACTSPKTYDDEPDGSYTFRVRQTDAAGNTSGAATRTITVVTADVGTTGHPNPFADDGIRWYPTMGVYRGSNTWADEDSLIDTQYDDYVGTAHQSAYLDLDTTDHERYWFCGGRRYDWNMFYVNENTAPPSRAQAQDPNWSNYIWNQPDADGGTNDVIDEMLDASDEVAADRAKACMFIAWTSTADSDAVPNFMTNTAGMTWTVNGATHVRLDNTTARNQVSDFLQAVVKQYGDDERIANMILGEYYPGNGSPLTSTQNATYRSNMKTVWSEMIAAAPEDANGERISIMQSNPITSGGQVTPTDLDTIGMGVTGSDPNIFEVGDQNETTLKQLYGDVPLSHLANAVRLVGNYQVTWGTADNPFGYALNSQHQVGYDNLAWYHGTQGIEDSLDKVTLDSLMMRDAGNATDKALLDAQWHDAYGRFGPNGTDADEWGQIPNYPAP